MNKLQKSLLLMLGMGVVVCAAPVAGAVLGASLATNAVVGGIIGFGIGAALLPLPLSFNMTKGAPSASDKGKSRLERMAGVTLGMYGVVGMVLKGMICAPFEGMFRRKGKAATGIVVPDAGAPASIPLTGLKPAFDTAQEKPETPAPVAQPAALAKTPEPPKP